MASRKSILALGLFAAVSYAGWDWLETHIEVATLHAAGTRDDYFPRVFIVDDGEGAWIRAERPDRFWLDAIRANPHVTVRRGERDIVYDATIWNGEWSHEHVDALFRAKYGVFDRLSGWIWRRNEVPIRLDPRWS